MALTRLDLADTQCSRPGCTHGDCEIFLHGRCHPSAGSRVSYNKRTGELHVKCRACQKHIATLEIAVGRVN